MKIQEIVLYSQNVNQQQNFYGTILGFEWTRSADGVLSVHCGESRLTFRPSNNSFYYHYCILIPTGSLESAIQWLDRAKVPPLYFQNQRIVSFQSGRSVYFKDTDGNIGEFIERPSLDLPKSIKFTPRSIIRLNEMGFPSDQPKDTAQDLIEKFGIEVLEDGPWRDDFVWCGDYQGALVISSTGRNWLPLNDPAEKVEFEMTFQTRSGHHQLKVR